MPYPELTGEEQRGTDSQTMRQRVLGDARQIQQKRFGNSTLKRRSMNLKGAEIVLRIERRVSDLDEAGDERTWAEGGYAGV